MPEDLPRIPLTLLVLLAVLAGQAAAGPVRIEEPALAQDGAGSLRGPGSTGPGPLGPLVLPGSPMTALPSTSVTANPADSSDALAAEIFEEVEAGVAGASPEAATSVQRAAAQSVRLQPPGSTQAHGGLGEAEGDGILRGTGKAARDWMTDNLAWLHGEPEGGAERPYDASARIDWSGSPFQGGNSSRIGTSGLQAAPFRSGATIGHPPTLAGADPSLVSSDGAEGNQAKEALSSIREILGHPMSWLVISLFVIGGFVMSKVDRRPE